MLNVGDAVLTFLGDTTQLDQVFARIPAQTEAAMGAAAGSVGQLGTATQGVNFELDATGTNAAYAGGMIEEGMTKGSMSTREAHGALMLVENMFGVHLPRALTTLLAHIGIINAAFSEMLPIIGAIAAVAIIVKLIEHHEALAKAQAKAALEVENLRIKEDDHTKSMELSNLKLDDQIAKLEGRPDRNKLKEAMLETSIASDALATQFSKDFEKIDEAIINATSIVGTFWSELHSLANLLSVGPSELAEAWDRMKNGTRNAAAALELVHNQMVLINKLRTEQVKAEGEDKEVAAAQALGTAYNVLAQLQQRAFEVVQKESPKNVEAMDKLKEGILSATAAEKDFVLQADNIHKHATLAYDEAAEAAKRAAEKMAIAADKAFEKQAKDAKNEADYEHKIWQEKYTEAVSALQESERLKITATKEGTTARIAILDAAIKEEQSKGLQDTSFYKSLLVQKVKAEQDAANESEKALGKHMMAEEGALKQETKLVLQHVADTYHPQEEAIAALAKFHLLTEQGKANRLELLYSQEAKASLDALRKQLHMEEVMLEESKRRLDKANANPSLFTKDQLHAMEANLEMGKQAVLATQTEILKAQDKFDKTSLALDKGRYGQALAMAVASGKVLLAEKLKENHAALLTAQAELAEAKARGINTAAIVKEVNELKKIEAELKKEVGGTQALQKAIVELSTQGQAAYGEMVTSFSTAMSAMMTGQQSFGAAMEASTFKMIAGMAQKWAAYFMSLAIGSWPNFAAMAEYTAAAVGMEALAGALSGMASNVSKSSGAAASGATTINTTGTSATNSPATNPTGAVNVPHLADGGLITAPTLAMLHPNEAVIPLNDDSAMRQIAEAIDKHMAASGDGGNHFYFNGAFISADTAGKVMKKFSRQVQTGRARLVASNTHKITRRG